MGGKHKPVSEGGKSRAKPLGQGSSLFGKKEHPEVRGNGMASTEEAKKIVKKYVENIDNTLLVQNRGGGPPGHLDPGREVSGFPLRLERS